ncbi:MAG: TetR/AcrR family transcriptional regulator [Desulfobacteraceae bacterium]|jgi:AcrR family transcriptional regulator
MNKNDALTLRVNPTQKRAKEKIALILDTAAQLLDEIGSDALTTKRIAQRASIRVRNVYRYFPNKQAVIYALAQTMALKQSEYIDNFALIANPDVDLEKALEVTVDSFLKAVIEQPGILSIRKAMQSSPELRLLDEQFNVDLADKLAKAFKKRGALPDGQDLDLICTVIIDVSTALLDRAGAELAESRDFAKAGRIVDELKRILKAYSAAFLNGVSLHL